MASFSICETMVFEIQTMDIRTPPPLKGPHLLCIYSTLVFKKLFFTVLQQQTAFYVEKCLQLIFC